MKKIKSFNFQLIKKIGNLEMTDDSKKKFKKLKESLKVGEIVKGKILTDDEIDYEDWNKYHFGILISTAQYFMDMPTACVASKGICNNWFKVKYIELHGHEGLVNEMNINGKDVVTLFSLNLKDGIKRDVRNHFSQFIKDSVSSNVGQHYDALERKYCEIKGKKLIKYNLN